MPSSVYHTRTSSPPREAVHTLEKIIQDRVPQAPPRKRRPNRGNETREGLETARTDGMLLRPRQLF